MGAAEWREADDLCSPLLPPTALDSLNVAPTPSPVAWISPPKMMWKCGDEYVTIFDIWIVLYYVHVLKV